MSCRGYSLPLQRAITDFGADNGFGRIPEKLGEHYGITVPVSPARIITENHARQVFENDECDTDISGKRGAERLIAETDGSTVPIVKTDTEAEDKRKTRKVCRKEARLSLSYADGSVAPGFGAAIGKPDDAGKRLFMSSVRAGSGENTEVHCVGDGAPRIAEQISTIFGFEGSCMIDFYHLCDYISAAGNVCAPADKVSRMEYQKECLKNNRIEEVPETLRPYPESEKVPNSDAPVRACCRYITNRPGQSDYKNASAKGLPIGSGQIESAHRYVIQERLKISGAWWKEEHAQEMPELRVLRADKDWDKYRNAFSRKAA